MYRGNFDLLTHDPIWNELLYIRKSSYLYVFQNDAIQHHSDSMA